MDELRAHRMVMAAERLTGRDCSSHEWHYRQIFQGYGVIDQMKACYGPGGEDYSYGAECTFTDGKTAVMRSNWIRPLINQGEQS